MNAQWKTRVLNPTLSFYTRNESKVDATFFLGGVFLDIIALAAVDDPFSIIQQMVYLTVIGMILAGELLTQSGRGVVPERWSRVWNYRNLILHFLMGSLLSLYSLFYLKSASFFASFFFLAILVVLVIGNELKFVQRGNVALKSTLYFICVFSFLSVIYPVLLSFVGWAPFLLSLGTLALFLWGIRRLLLKWGGDPALVRVRLTLPGAIVSGVFFFFYTVGWIPPVPLSLQKLGIYHRVEKQEGDYVLWQERSWWKFWHQGDQEFHAEPGDELHIFVSVFSPARFDDSVILHWSFNDSRAGWQTTDQIPMRIAGGRKGGYRGSAVKQNYTEGEWRVAVETTDGREIGRIYFTVIKTEVSDPDRKLVSEIY